MKEVFILFLIPTTLSCAQSSSPKTPAQSQDLPEYNYAAIRDGAHVEGLPVQDIDHISLTQALEEQDHLYIQQSGWSRILNALKKMSCRR